jgi:S1-C subfamily serine protease
MPQVEIKIDATPRAPAQTDASVPWMGATLHCPSGEEMSAYGVSFDTKGVAIQEIDAASPLAGPQGLRKGDLILNLEGRRVTSIDDLRKALDTAKNGRLRLRVIRDQKPSSLDLTVANLQKP